MFSLKNIAGLSITSLVLCCAVISALLLTLRHRVFGLGSALSKCPSSNNMESGRSYLGQCFSSVCVYGVAEVKQKERK